MSVLRRKARPQTDVERQIRDELAEILPLLRIEQCAIERTGFDPVTGTATLHVAGGCPDCDASAVTFIRGIEAQLKSRVTELRSVALTVAGD